MFCQKEVTAVLEATMVLRPWIAATVVAAFTPAPVLAGDTGFFAGLDLSGGAAFGSSETTDGGAPWAGGGVVGNVEFHGAFGIGGEIGYRFDPVLSAFVSYLHSQGGVSWDADFPAFGVASHFEGTAASDAVMANLGYDFALSGDTTLSASAGIGLSFNTLSGVVETVEASGQFLADVAARTRVSPAAQLGAGIRHRLTPSAILGLDAALSYNGGFATGNTRSGNLGVTAINPYEIDDVWRARLGASLRFEF